MQRALYYDRQVYAAAVDAEGGVDQFHSQIQSKIECKQDVLYLETGMPVLEIVASQIFSGTERSEAGEPLFSFCHLSDFFMTSYWYKEVAELSFSSKGVAGSFATDQELLVCKF